MDEVKIRAAADDDALSISTLLAELGYPAEPDAIPARLAALAAYPVAVTLVAAAGSEVYGVITAHVLPSIHAAEPVAWITSLVVASDVRGMGVGSMLVSEIESWARQNGAVRVSVTSGTAREQAHRFYERRGYERSGLRFTRMLSRED